MSSPRGHLLFTFSGEPGEPAQVTVGVQGDIYPLDAVVAFGMLLDRAINQERPELSTSFRWAGATVTEVLRSMEPRSPERGDAQAGAIRAVVEDLIRNRPEAGIRVMARGVGDA
jgi:hypothetical protein